MEDKSLELLTEDGRRLYEEFRLCQNEQELEALMERENKLNESQGIVDIPHLDMTLEEYRRKYHTTPLEEIRKKYGV